MLQNSVMAWLKQTYLVKNWNLTLKKSAIYPSYFRI